MIASLWHRIRRTEELEALSDALADKIHDSKIDENAIAGLRRDLEIERAKRIGAEAIAAERRAEVDRLVAELADARAATERAYAERLKSLDSLNVRLMEPRVESPPPDMAKFSAESLARAEKMGTALHAIRNVREIHRHMDLAILRLGVRKVPEQTPAGPVMNAEGA